MNRNGVVPPVAAAIAMIVAALACLFGWHMHTSDAESFAAQQRSVELLTHRVDELEARAGADPDWSSIALRVESSVVTIETANSLGSAWVVRSDAQGTDLVTNFHVIEAAFSDGTAKVQIRHDDRTVEGTIVRVDRTDDLALIHIDLKLSPLPPATARPKVGSTVVAVGSPLGLDGSVSIGVVSGYRSLDGSDYIQFSAPVSPGNSGGPVVDSQGRVVAVASAKLVGDGVEALSLAIPVQVACENLAACSS
ncbi:MAG TPA: trypsin-like peptidase domain-containing protein [Candidatus Dormibacteraeota bacterium]|nr:trypsin-like peptidase domain-containing protein [Candidatus Dormibacteraeota bacterium]